MNFWKYSLRNRKTEIVECTKGFFSTREAARTAARQEAVKSGDPDAYEIILGEHWRQMDEDSVEDFEDRAFCDYADTIEEGIREVFEAVHGRELSESCENECDAIDTIRENLAKGLHGCYPANITKTDPETGEEEDVPCCTGPCEYGCSKCPILHGKDFPEYAPDSDDLDSMAAELVRCVKCESEHTATEEEILIAVAAVKL